ncbi:MAG: phage tail tape measure protein, partial [Clostridia bacterium]|nr:phage tail tape measure protein [Clostridia bacterium]
MANKIKGITIEIDGSTQKLQTAMKDINSTSRDLSQELKEVDRLLKLDPKNTEIITQKHKLLADAIGASKDKLDVLKEAERQVKEQFDQGKVGEDQYRAIQREVANADQELKKLESTLKNVNSGWSNAAADMKKFGDGAEKAGKKLAPVSAVAAAGGIAAAKMSLDFGDAMAKVATISDSTAVPLEDMQKAIISLSNETGISAGAIAEDVYNAISAGQDTADAVGFVGQSLKLSRAGFAETGDSLDLLTTVLNAYTLGSEDAVKVSDILIQTQNKGKVTVGELSAVMGKIIPTAKMANVNLEQLGAGYAILTSNGIAAAESTTYMNSMLNELTKSGSKSDKALKELTGKSFADLSAEGKSIADILEILSEEATNSGISLADMFGSAEASKAALTLLGDGAEGFNEMLAEMGNSAGNTETALEKLDTPAQKIRESFNKLQNAAIKVGDALAPVIDKVSGFIEKLADKLVNMDDKTLNLIVVVGMLVAALAPVLIIVGKVASGISALMGLFSTISGLFAATGAAAGTAAGGAGVLGTVLTALTGPVGIVIGLIAALTAVVVYLWKNNEEFREAVIAAWDKIKEAGVAVWGWLEKFFTEDIPTAISNAIDWFKQLPEKVQEFFSTLPEKIGFILGTVLGKLIKWGADSIQTVKTEVPKIISKVVEFFAGLPAKMAEKLSLALKSIGTWITNGITKVTTEVPRIVKGIVDAFMNLPSEMLNIGKNVVTGLWDGIAEKITWLHDKVSSFAKGVTGGIKNVLGIQSPSKVMRQEVGKMIPSGIALGITDNLGMVDKAMKSINGELALDMTTKSSASTGNNSMVEHTGKIVVEGVNDKGSLIAVVD